MTSTVRRNAGAIPRRVLTVGAIIAVTLAASPLAAHALEGRVDHYDVRFAADRPVDGEHRHVVEQGEYLSTIAADYGLDEDGGWKVLFDANEHIDHPDLIHVGEEILIPEEGETLTSRPLPDEPVDTAGAEGEQSSGSSPSEGTETPGDRGPDPTASVGSGVWDRLAACESNRDWSINTGNGYYGGLQFDKGSWDWAGGGQYAEYPHLASRAQQIAVAERLLVIHPGGWGAWPACASKLGLR